MNYKCSYNNSTFPYNHNQTKSNCSYNKKESKNMDSCINNYSKKQHNNDSASYTFSNILNSILAPVEKSIGRKIKFDDILIVALIYLLYTEKDNDNNLLLLCLLFLLFN